MVNLSALLDETSKDQGGDIGVVQHSSLNPASWSGSISEVKSRSSFMQMAGEPMSERTAQASSSMLS
jgi:hypothetical protein